MTERENINIELTLQDLEELLHDLLNIRCAIEVVVEKDE